MPHYNRHARQFAMLHDPFTIRMAQLGGEICMEDAVERLEHTGRDGVVFAGKMAVELAAKATDFDSASHWIQRAGSNFERAIDSAHDTTQRATRVEARLGLAQLPLVGYLAMFHKLPPRKLVEKAYEGSLEAMSEVEQDFKHFAHRNGSEEKSSLVGIATETAVLLLGQRYALSSSIDESSWLPLHSLYSEDHNNKTRNAYSRAWDITFYTDINNLPEQSYLVQVKSSDYTHPERGRRNASIEPIIELNFNPDLAFPNEKGLPAMATLRELQKELSGDPTTQHNLHIRTEKLLDILG